MFFLSQFLFELRLVFIQKKKKKKNEPITYFMFLSHHTIKIKTTYFSSKNILCFIKKKRNKEKKGGRLGALRFNIEVVILETYFYHHQKVKRQKYTLNI
jgi:hypothetical protein